jgi:hypothetical protein
VLGRGQSAVVGNGEYLFDCLTSCQSEVKGEKGGVKIDADALVFLGLGGTSLINANVFMEADKETLAMKAWPPEIRDNVDELDRCKSRRRIRDE